jgi:hypothetical protein
MSGSLKHRATRKREAEVLGVKKPLGQSRERLIARFVVPLE